MGRRKQFEGVVTSSKMQKTVVVQVMRIKKHVKYDRLSRMFNSFKAHDEGSVAKTGDIVRIEETRPLSKDKRWRVIQVVKKATVPDLELKDVSQ